jgi:hypothetical protein
MCTVTFLPLSDTHFLLTSNRDEQATRVTLSPEIYREKGVSMLYPKDKSAGGTWIGVSELKRLVCVLNGGFVRHVRKPAYSRSRGLLAKELLTGSDLDASIAKLDLDGVEPFTMVLVDWSGGNSRLIELVWDEIRLHVTELPQAPRIWSSSTLYRPEIKAEREERFEQWLESTTKNRKNILDFHHNSEGDPEQSILMYRPYVQTVSITSVCRNGREIDMHYEDLVRGGSVSKTL